MRIALPMSVESPWSIEVARRLSELGHEVHVIDFSLPYDESAVNLATDDWIGPRESLTGIAQQHYLKFSANHNLRYLVCAGSMRRIFQRHRIQMVLALSASGFAAMTYLSGFRPYAVYTTGSDVLVADGFKRWITKRLLYRAAGIFSNGLYLREKTAELCGRHDVQPLYLGVDAERFSPGADKQGRPVQILASRVFKPVYNNEYLIRALALLPESVPLGKVVFPSTGPDLARIRALAKDILPPPVQHKVLFCGGVTDNEMLGHLQESDIYVSLSRSDGTSISTMEALSCGLFPVVSDIPQNREWVAQDGENGLLVPLDQPHVLADALRRAILDGSLRKQAKRINRSLILERADGRRNIAWLSIKLEDILDKHHKR